MKTKYAILFSAFFVITGCQNSSLKQNIDEEQRIYIHQTTKNYGGLIELYKQRLQRVDSVDTRYKLAQAYYLSNDFNSARRALLPIINNVKDDNALVLYAHIESKLGNYVEALRVLEQSTLINNKNGEAYNLKGIILIKTKQYDAARYSFTQARNLFYDENKVANNLAMLSILNKEYDDAYNQLNILYSKGYRNKALLHNLLYTLVKLNRIQLAKTFCDEHKLSNRTTILIEELKQIDPVDVVNFNTIVPEQEQKQKQYSFEKLTENKTIENQNDKLKIQPISNDITKSTLDKQPLNTEKTTQQLNTIKNILSGEHDKFSRIAFYSSNKLANADYSVTPTSSTEFIIKINNVQLSGMQLNSISKLISLSNRDLTKVTVKQETDNSLIITVNTKHQMSVKTFYAGVNAKNKLHSLAIDFYSK